jgi:hypothetical protein
MAIPLHKRLMFCNQYKKNREHKTIGEAKFEKRENFRELILEKMRNKFLDCLSWSGKRKPHRLEWEDESHEKKEKMSVLQRVVPSSSPKLPSTENMCKRVLPGVADPSEMAKMEREESAVRRKPTGEGGEVAKGTPRILAEVAGRASGVRWTQSKGAKTKKPEESRDDCKTNRVGSTLHEEISTNPLATFDCKTNRVNGGGDPSDRRNMPIFAGTAIDCKTNRYRPEPLESERMCVYGKRTHSTISSKDTQIATAQADERGDRLAGRASVSRSADASQESLFGLGYFLSTAGGVEAAVQGDAGRVSSGVAV